MKIAGLVLLLVGLSGSIIAGPVSAPEIDPGSAAGAIALVSGALLVIRGRRKR
jgi:hypothetical protein